MTDDAALPNEYAETFRAIRDRVTATRSRVQLAANAHLIHLYWSIGSVLLERSKTGRWGSGVLRQLAEDLRVEFGSAVRRVLRPALGAVLLSNRPGGATRVRRGSARHGQDHLGSGR
jgi:hypothetical protein